MQATVALAGNPNSGKTTLFNELTGARQHVGNYPGVTVEKKRGPIPTKISNCTLLIYPGRIRFFQQVRMNKLQEILYCLANRM